ncbi:MAG: methyltransferase [Verrucomicrobia bacterium]|nr:methyltransferase [Verrucomicrobiota bacterium]
MPQPTALDRFLPLLRSALTEGTLTKLTLGKPSPALTRADPTLHNLFVRPVALKTGPQLTFVWRHATRDVTKNHPPAEALAIVEAGLGRDFLDAHLFTATQTAQLEFQPDATARLRVKTTSAVSVPGAGPTPSPAAHNQPKHYLIPADAPWLDSLGVTNNRGQPRDGMADKFRQIQKFAELLTHLITEANFPPDRLIRVVDMGSGKGYLTFAVAALLGDRAHVTGIEARPELVALCNRVAAQHGGARLLVVSPCCQKELRPQLSAPPVLADALRHGIFQERQAEFVTDALRAQLLEWSGYQTKVFEFVSTEHTAKNLMISAIKARAAGAPDDARASRVRDFARFYGIRTQHLATRLGFALTA